MTDLVVWGLGSLGRPVLDRIADHHPRRELVAVVRDPDRPPPLPPNVTAAGLEVLAGTAAPVLVCVADNEAEVLRPYLAGGRIEAGRAAVARRNLALLERHVETRHWKERPVLVVTNPVEPLCGYLAGAVGCRPVYGAGMQIDAERCRTVLAVGWHVRLAPDELPMTGTHGMTPVPVLSAVPGLARQVAGEPWPEVCARLCAAAAGLDWVLAPERLVATLTARMPEPADDPYARVGLAVAALMAAEFSGGRPPTARAAAHVAALVDAWFAGGTVPASGACAWPGVPGEVFVGGVADFATGRFTVPALDATETALVRGQLAAAL